MISVMVTLSEWLFRAVLGRSVLTLSPEYFGLRKPLERRVYELARKHCGRQPEWRISVGTLHKKAGSAAPVRVFRAAIRKMIEEAPLPDYAMSEEPGDMIRFTRAGVIEDAFTESVDVMPTILEWLGGEIPRACDGQSLLPLLAGPAPHNDPDLIALARGLADLEAAVEAAVRTERNDQ